MTETLVVVGYKIIAGQGVGVEVGWVEDVGKTEVFGRLDALGASLVEEGLIYDEEPPNRDEPISELIRCVLVSAEYCDAAVLDDIFNETLVWLVVE